MSRKGGDRFSDRLAPESDEPAGDTASPGRQRIDRWLWHATACAHAFGRRGFGRRRLRPGQRHAHRCARPHGPVRRCHYGGARSCRSRPEGAGIYRAPRSAERRSGTLRGTHLRRFGAARPKQRVPITGLALSRSQDELFRQSMIPKGGNRFSEKIVLHRNI